MIAAIDVEAASKMLASCGDLGRAFDARGIDIVVLDVADAFIGNLIFKDLVAAGFRNREDRLDHHFVEMVAAIIRIDIDRLEIDAAIIGGVDAAGG